MADSETSLLELSPSSMERLVFSIIAIIGLIIGIIGIVGALVVDFITDVAMFVTIFIASLFVFFSLWRILRISTTRLYIDSERILYRERFVWKEISWSDVISIGQAHEVDTKEQNTVLSKIRALLILTDKGLRKFDMSPYSMSHSHEIIEKIMDSRPKLEIENEEEEEQ
ncbi:MAG: hypothetical protein FK730_10775 [Asgard group archaeon]|nr:hypothetical protein [Asgard group archaeon]